MKTGRSLPKAPTGINGLDEVTGGGLPRGRPTLVCGPAGCGKTLLATEFLVRGIVEFGEPGVFVAFEESREDLIANVASLGFDLAQLEQRRTSLARRREAVLAQTAALWREFEDEADIVGRLLSHGSSGAEDRAGQRAEQGRMRGADAKTPASDDGADASALDGDT